MRVRQREAEQLMMGCGEGGGDLEVLRLFAKSSCELVKSLAVPLSLKQFDN